MKKNIHLVLFLICLSGVAVQTALSSRVSVCRPRSSMAVALSSRGSSILIAPTTHVINFI